MMKYSFKAFKNHFLLCGTTCLLIALSLMAYGCYRAQVDTSTTNSSSLETDKEPYEVLWTYAIDADHKISPPVVLGDRVFFCSIHKTGRFNYAAYAVNKHTGELLWERELEYRALLIPPVAAKDTVFFVSRKKFYAFDAATGDIQWEYEADIDDHFYPYIVEDTVFAGKEGLYYAEETDDYLYAFDLSTGRVKWKTKLPEKMQTGPIVANELVYIGVHGKMLAYEASTGKELWVFPFAERWGWAWDPVVNEEIICFVAEPKDSNPFLYALDAYTGEEKWKLSPPEQQSFHNYSPIIVGDRVYIHSSFHSVDSSSSSMFLYSIDAETGVIIHEPEPIPINFFHKKIIADEDFLYFGGAGYLHAFFLHNETPNEAWKINLRGKTAIYHGPFVQDRVVYFAIDNYLYAIRNLAAPASSHEAN